MIVYKKGSGYVHKRGHIYKMKPCVGTGVIDSIIKTIVDFVSTNKDVLKHIGETGVNTVKIGQNTRQIVNSIRNESKPRDLTVNENLAYEHKDLQNIIKKINTLKFGEGFRYTYFNLFEAYYYYILNEPTH